MSNFTIFLSEVRCPAGTDTLDSSLAWAELYLVLAAMYARFDFVLHETLFDDIEIGSDQFTPVPRSRNGVRVTIHRVNVS